MAVTKIWQIKSTLNKALAYIENPEKTQGQLLVSGYNTEPQMACLDFEMTAALARKVRYTKSKRGEILAHHMMQSFAADDNVTPEEAHELGRKLASEFTEGKFEFVVSTHVDKDCIHNHIIINAVSFYDYKRLRTVPFRTTKLIRSISDRLCAEANLSVIAFPERAGIPYEKYMKQKRSTSVRGLLRKRLNFVLQHATSYEEFKSMAAELGVVVDDTKQHLVYEMEGAERNIRADTLADTDKYMREGIFTQVAENAENQAFLQQSIETAAHGVSSYEEFTEQLAGIGVQIKTNKAGAVSYRLPDAYDNAQLPETALSEAYATDAIKAVLAGKLATFPARATRDFRACFEQQAKATPNDPDTLVALSQAQILKASWDGLLISVTDAAGNPASVMLDKAHVVRKEGQTFAVLGNKFDYALCGEHGLDSIKGEALIRQLEVANGVRPQSLQVSQAQIKGMSLRGVTLTLPEAGIERLFIPAQYVKLDKVSQTCHVHLYDNWTYTFAPIADAKAGYQPRKSIMGALLCDALTAARQQGTEGDLSGRIRFVEKQSQLSEIDFLADMLRTMAQSPAHSSQGIALRQQEAFSERTRLEGQIKGITEKCMQYRFAARHLETVQTYQGLAQEMFALPPKQQEKFRRRHETELTAYELALRELERIDVRPEVLPEKVVALIQNREQQIADLQSQIQSIRQREQELDKMQLYVEDIQEKRVEADQRKNDRRR